MDIAIVTLDTFGAKMAGPAIRVWEMASLLSSEQGGGHRVRVLSFGGVNREAESFELLSTTVGGLRGDLGTPGVVIIQGFLAQTFPWLVTSDFYSVVDLYDPFHIESLQVERFQPEGERLEALNYAVGELNAQIRGGDFFVCASDKQRDMWLGHLGALGRLNPLTYDADESLRALIDVAPFGIPAEKPTHTRHALRGVVPGIGEDDKIIVWGGGVYNWFDPLTVIRAVARARSCVPNVRLFFMGAKHPNPDVPQMHMLREARALSDELGLTGTHVFFNEEWVDYNDRHNYLLEADLGVSAHLPGLETDFSFRTRMLDYLWTGLPIVASEGDVFASLIAAEELGRAVPVRDEAAMSDAFVALLSDDDARAACARAVTKVAGRYRWHETLAPLVNYCANPWEAADRKLARRGADVPDTSADAGKQRGVLRGLPVGMLARKALRTVRDEGPRATVRKVRRYIAHRLPRA